MHPEKRDIREYVHGRKTASTDKQLAEHLEVCEFCAEYAEEIRAQMESLEAAKQEPPGTKAERMKQRIISQAFPPSLIHLQELHSEEPASNQLAADGQQVSPRWEHLKTLFCESPDVVLRLTRDTEMARDYLQVIADDSSLYAHVMVSVPDKDLSVITDANGRADICVHSDDDADLIKLKPPRCVDTQLDCGPSAAISIGVGTDRLWLAGSMLMRFAAPNRRPVPLT